MVIMVVMIIIAVVLVAVVLVAVALIHLRERKGVSGVLSMNFRCFIFIH